MISPELRKPLLISSGKPLHETDETDELNEIKNKHQNKPFVCKLIDRLYEAYKTTKSYSITTYDPSEHPIELTHNKVVHIKLLCNWTTSERLTNVWKKMSQDGQGRWGNLQLTTDSDVADFFVIINSTKEYHEPHRSIVFHMEPFIPKRSDIWGKWSLVSSPPYLNVMSHERSYNNIEWHIGRTYEDLRYNVLPDKDYEYNISTVLSSKTIDPGHKLRTKFVLYAQDYINIQVFGDDLGYKHYKGKLPYHQKDNALFPYKYTFNAENNSIDNYFTEKLIDGILAECVVFYWGCPNISLYVDPCCYIKLPLEDTKKSLEIVLRSIQERSLEKRIDVIRREKKKILDTMQFFPRLEKTLLENEKISIS